MRRPHPRFDKARNAWVTRAGGKLKILASGPKNGDTEAAAWEAFYAHMAQRGNPVEGSFSDLTAPIAEIVWRSLSKKGLARQLP